MLFFQKYVHLLNMQNGLADNTVSAVYKDKEGFVWFGTRNGLSRYDGRRITNFEISSSYPSISNLKEAFDGVLAFVDNGVFSAFDLKKNAFCLWFLLRDRAFHLEGCCRRMIRWFG